MSSSQSKGLEVKIAKKNLNDSLLGIRITWTTQCNVHYDSSTLKL